MPAWPTKSAAGALAALAILAAAARADTIRTHKGIGYSGQIVGLDAEGIVVRSGGVQRSVALADISRVEADKYPELARAEDIYAQGVAGKEGAFADAERIYRALVRDRPPAWLRLLVQARMYRLYVESGRVVDAVDAYLEMARSQPKLVVGLTLPAPAEGAHDANKAMLGKVEAALREAADKPYTGELRNFRIALKMLEGSPEEVLPLLEPLLASPNEKTRQTAMLRRVELLLATNKTDEAARRFGEAAQALGDAAPAETAYWRARVAEARGEPLAAALDFMRLPILYADQDKNRTADALFRAGEALKAAGVPRDEIVKVFREAVTRYSGTTGAERARRELAQMGAK